MRGEVVVELFTPRTERLAVGSVLDTDRATTLEVEHARPHQHRWIVQFRGVSSREDADALRDVVLRSAPLPHDDEELWVHELIGARVVERDGTSLGSVEAVEANPASDLLVLGDGGLIPLRFVVERREGTLVVDIPEGLLDP